MCQLILGSMPKTGFANILTRSSKGMVSPGLQMRCLATGYTTLLSPPGPDGGVDIIAGRGAMGFEHPRLCVQVKSSSGPVNVEVLRSLHGTMKNFSAEQGLLISWGGFNDKVRAEARSQFFSIRLWDSGVLIQALLELYEK